MAKKTEETETKIEAAAVTETSQEAQTEQTASETVTENAPVENTPDSKTEQSSEPVKSTQETTLEPSKTQNKAKLISFTELCNKHRLPTWQSAAVLRLLEKEDDVHLSEKEFLQALERLNYRKMGTK